MKLFKFVVEYQSTNGNYFSESVGVFSHDNKEAAINAIQSKWKGNIKSINEVDYGSDAYLTTNAMALSDHLRVIAMQKKAYQEEINRINEEMNAIGYAIGREMEEQFEVISGVLWQLSEEDGEAFPMDMNVKVY